MNVATILQCKKCGKSRAPSTFLQCCHTVCKQCLKADTTPPAPAVVCPVCQKEAQTSRENEDLYSNLNTCMRTVSKVLGSRVTEGETNCCVCHLQNVVRPTTHQCLNCGDTLCEACRQGHQSSSATYAHKIVSIEEIRKGKYKVSVQKNFPCSDDKHDGKKYEFYCDSCNKPLCAMCLVLNHMGHQIIPLEEASARCRSTLHELSQKMEEKLNGQVKSTRDMLIRHRKTIEKTQETTVSAVREQTQALIELILKQEQTLVGKITELSNQQRRDINLHETNLEQVLEMGAKAVVLSKGAFEEGADEECVLLFHDLTKCLDSTSLEKSEAKVAKFTAALKTPVYTIQYNFPEPSSMLSITETLLEPRFYGVLKPESVPKAGTMSPQPERKLRREDLHPSVKSDLKGSSLMERSDTTGKEYIHKETAGINIVSQSSMRESVTPGREERDKHHQTVSPNKRIKEQANSGEVFRVTESLSIVGEFGRSLSLNEYCESVEDLEGEQNTLPSTKDLLPDAVPGALDCNVYPPYQLSSNHSPRGDLEGIKSESIADLSALTSSLPKTEKTFCLVKKATCALRVAKDLVDPIIVGMCRFHDTRIVVLDDANKKVRLTKETGVQYGVTHPNIITESLSPNGVVACGSIIVFISGKTVYITDSVPSLKQKVELDISDSTQDTSRLPLCQYTDTSFLIGNLPGNKCRLYNTNGGLIQEQDSPVKGPIVAICRTNDGQLLYSSWDQPGAVYQFRISGVKVQTYRPTGVISWYPEGICVDMKNNVYVADPREDKIHVFRSNGSQLHVHTVAVISSPRCLLMMPNSTLFVSGDGPCLHPYRCTYSTMM